MMNLSNGRKRDGEPSALDRVDEVCQRFETQWKTDSPPRIEDYVDLGVAGDAAGFAYRLLVDLVLMDLEYRRRTAPGPSARTASQLDAETLGSQQPVDLPVRPLLEDYVRKYPALGAVERLGAEIIADEYHIRHCCGERPDHAEYQRRFPRQAEELAALLKEVDEDLEPSPASPLPEPGTSRRAARISVNEFFRRLGGSGLMDAEEIRGMQSEAADQAGDADAAEIAERLVSQGKLTAFQADALCRGTLQRLVLGNYILLEKLGEGGMGQVFKARHRHMDRMVAVKVLTPALVENKQAVARFRHEVQAAARLSHPNIVTAHDADQSDGRLFLVTEYVEGQDLARLLKARGALPLAEALGYALQAARGLQYAHGKGIVHRDIKPGNLLLDREGTVKILDMGLARIGQEEERGGERLTQSGQMVGTCDYMAPEQALDTKTADHRADIYALGCTLYRLLTGELPYRGETLIQVLLAHREAAIPSLCRVRPEVPAAVDAVFQRMVAKTPEARPQSMAEVIAELEACLKPPAGRQAAKPSRRKPAALFVGLALAGIIVVSLAIILRLRDPNTGKETAVHIPDGSDVTVGKQGELQVTLPKAADRRPQGHADVAGKASAAPAQSKPASQPPQADPPVQGLEQEVAAAASLAADDPKLEALWRKVALFQTTADWPQRERLQPLLARLASPLDKLDGETLPPLDVPVEKDVPLVGVIEPSLPQHWNTIWHLAVGHGGVAAASAGEDGTVRLWHLRQRRLMRTVVLDDKHFFGLAFSPDDKTLAIAQRNMIRLLGVSDGVLTDFDQTDGEPSSLRFTSDGKGLVAIVEGNTRQAVTWDVATKQKRQTHDLPAGLRCCGISPDGALAVLGPAQEGVGEVTLWDVVKGNARHLGVLDLVHAAFSPEGKLVCLAEKDRGEIYSVADGKLLRTFETPDISRCAISADGRVVGTGYYRSVLYLSQDDQAMSRIGFHFSESQRHIYCLPMAFLPDGATLLTGGGDGDLRLWDLTTGRGEPLVSPATGHRAVALALSPSGRTVALACADSILRLRDLVTGKTRPLSFENGVAVDVVAWSPRGDRLAIITTGPAKDEEPQAYLVLRNEQGDAISCVSGVLPLRGSLAFSPDGQTFAASLSPSSIWDRGCISRWRADDGAAQGEVNEGAHPLSIAWSGDGRRIAKLNASFGPRDGRDLLQVVDIATGKLTAPKMAAMERSSERGEVVYSPDGKWLACAHVAFQTGEGLAILDARSGEQVVPPGLDITTGRLHCLAFSPDGKLLAAAGERGTVYLFDVGSWRCLKQFKLGRGINDLMYQVRFSPEGRHLLTLNGDGSVYVLRLRPREPSGGIGP
jgi:serine/threonine protein kinase/WD40 repeat protein